MSFATMSAYRALWFMKPCGRECYCNECCADHYIDKVIKLYSDRGLVLEHGMIVSLVHCKKALEIMQERLEAPKQPPKLELLTAWQVEEQMPLYVSPGCVDSLPLPTPIVKCIKDGTYDDAWDWEHWHLYDTACKIPGILWLHVGCKLVMDGTLHPGMW